jgi:hypothetical protein
VPTNTIANIRYDLGSRFIAIVGEDAALESRALGFVWPASTVDVFQTWDAVDSVFEAAFRAVTVDPLRMFLGGEPRQFGTAWTLTAHRMPSVPKLVRKVAVDGRRSPFKGELQEAI